jgi:hypothetical protein
MKYRSLAFLIVASALTVAHAQDEDRQRPPTEIPDFSNLDEYIYEPKSTAILGFRHLSAAKAQFSGSGFIGAPIDPNPGLGGHYYNDGEVRADLRRVPVLDSGGNPMIDPNSGLTISEPIAPDGKTNSWAYSDQKQVDQAPLGYIAFHSYSASVIDSAIRNADSRSTNGIDLAMSRDMGKLFGGKIAWNLVVGMSVNDISGKKLSRVDANIATITDLYSLYGQDAPPLPYDTVNGTSTTPQTVVDSNGNVTTVSVDSTVLIGSDPAGHSETTSTTSAADTPPTDETQPFPGVLDNWKVKGAYYTFRAGPELWFPISSRFRAGVSMGAAMVYAGTTYTVTQTFTPETGADVTTQDTSSVNKLLPGYFADATLQFDLTDKAGFFAGAVFQSAGSYTQSLESESAHYKTKIDLSNQNGFRAGMTVRF